jgi:tRNA-Thr(GGU) m(6)t(6)A37 methyltransferase TsaA
VQRLRAAAGTTIFLAVAPGVVAGLVPWLLTGWAAGGGPLWLRAAGWVVLALGVAVIVEAFARFVIEGMGTPAPVAPTEKLVVGGLYRYVRNPMYLAVAAVILGQAAVLGRWILLGYAVVFGATVWSFVHWYEEPTLRRRFGSAYDDYVATVPGWWPRPRPRPAPAKLPTGMDDLEHYSVQTIGVVRSPLRSRADAPNQAIEGAPSAVLDIDPAFGDALHRVEAGDELILLTWLHLADRSVLQTHPTGDRNIPLTGVFRTRSPDRPNPIGVHQVTVTALESATAVRVDALEAIDGTPIIDLKIGLPRSSEA